VNTTSMTADGLPYEKWPRAELVLNHSSHSLS